MRKYFDLNERAQRTYKNNGDTLILKGVPEILPKTGEHLKWNSAKLEIKKPTISVIHQLVMYLGTFFGVLLSTAVTHFRYGNVDVAITYGEIIVSAIIALVIIPLVYEKLMLNPKAPLIVQFGLFVQNGVFWHVLIDSIGNLL